MIPIYIKRIKNHSRVVAEKETVDVEKTDDAVSVFRVFTAEKDTVVAYHEVVDKTVRDALLFGIHHSVAIDMPEQGTIVLCKYRTHDCCIVLVIPDMVVANIIVETG